FGSSAHNHIRFSKANQHERIYQCVGGRCASGNRRIVRPHKSEFHGNMARRNIGNHFGDEERIESWDTVACRKITNFLLKRFDSADSRPPAYTYPRLVNTRLCYTPESNAIPRYTHP